jgi:acetoacetyl-CoA reductase
MGELCGCAGVVTGASRGIGRAIALELARNGASVAVGFAHSAEGAEEVVREIHALGCDAFPMKADVQCPEEVGPAIAAVAERFGKIDFLVNNAGIARDRSLAKMTHADWTTVINVDLHSVFNVTHEVLPYMLQRGYGRIVNVSSVVGQAGNFGQSNYAAAKAGIIGFTKSAALELAPKGITVNCIAPGFTETEMVEAMPDSAKQRVLEHVPMGRFGRPEEMAQAAVFLIAHGDYMTGQVIGINGGLYV